MYSHFLHDSFFDTFRHYLRKSNSALLRDGNRRNGILFLFIGRFGITIMIVGIYRSAFGNSWAISETSRVVLRFHVRCVDVLVFCNFDTRPRPRFSPYKKEFLWPIYRRFELSMLKTDFWHNSDIPSGLCP